MGAKRRSSKGQRTLAIDEDVHRILSRARERSGMSMKFLVRLAVTDPTGLHAERLGVVAEGHRKEAAR